MTDAYRTHYALLLRAALAHPRPAIASGWTAASLHAAAEALAGSREPRAMVRALDRIAGLVAGRWDRVVADRVRVTSTGPHAAAWAAIAARAPRERIGLAGGGVTFDELNNAARLRPEAM